MGIDYFNCDKCGEISNDHVGQFICEECNSSLCIDCYKDAMESKIIIRDDGKMYITHCPQCDEEEEYTDEEIASMIKHCHRHQRLVALRKIVNLVNAVPKDDYDDDMFDAWNDIRKIVNKLNIFECNIENAKKNQQKDC